MKKILACIILGVFSFSTIRCGYSTNILVASGFRTIHVEPFKNNIQYTSELQHDVYLPLLEVKAHNEVTNRFIFDGHLRIAEPQEADLILKGALVGYTRDVLRRTDSDDIEEYRIQVLVDLVLWDPEKEKVVWQERGFAGETTYFLTGPNATSESTAVDDAIKDLARRVVERAIEDW